MSADSESLQAKPKVVNILKYQIGMFLLCYFAWVTVHIQREFWAMSKKTIKVQHPDLSKTFFGAIDTSLFLTYALAQFFTGQIGDMYPQRKVLSISFAIQATLFFWVGVGGTFHFFHLYYFATVFAIIGMVQSVDFPCLIGTIGCWTKRKSRGMVSGAWATCSPIGNIIGLQLSVVILNNQNQHWEYQMYYITLGYFVVSVLIFFCFIASPEEIGVKLESESAIVVIENPDDFKRASASSSTNKNKSTENNQQENSKDQVSTESEPEEQPQERISFWEALRAPYVVLYGFCFFCVKFAVYAILLWMPMYLKETHGFNNQRIANVMSLYETGTIIGTVVLGLLSDKNEGARRSPTAIVSIFVALLISLSFVVFYNSYPETMWLISMFFYGFFLGSIHHMICVTITADLGRSHSKSATSTITGIIDGIGSSGNGAGQVFLGGMIQNLGWRYGFLLPVTIAVGCTLIPLTKIYFNERREMQEIKQIQSE